MTERTNYLTDFLDFRIWWDNDSMYIFGWIKDQYRTVYMCSKNEEKVTIKPQTIYLYLSLTWLLNSSLAYISYVLQDEI